MDFLISQQTHNHTEVFTFGNGKEKVYVTLDYSTKTVTPKNEKNDNAFQFKDLNKTLIVLDMLREALIYGYAKVDFFDFKSIRDLNYLEIKFPTTDFDYNQKKLKKLFNLVFNKQQEELTLIKENCLTSVILKTSNGQVKNDDSMFDKREVLSINLIDINSFVTEKLLELSTELKRR